MEAFGLEARFDSSAQRVAAGVLMVVIAALTHFVLTQRLPDSEAALRPWGT